MITKLFEIRDRGTFIPVIAVKAVPGRDGSGGVIESERYLLRRSGFGFDDPCIILCRAECSGIDRNATYDPYSWGQNPRTFFVAHEHILRNFDTLESGEVIDVEFILGETATKKQSERIT
jgi:hypothetical protein